VLPKEVVVMRRLGLLFATATLGSLSLHCGGDDPAPIPDAGLVPVPDGGAPQPDAGVIRPDGGIPPRPDAGNVAPNQNVRLSGSIYNLEPYLQGTRTPVGDVQVRALGVQGVTPVTTAPTGTYDLEIPQNGRVVIGATKAGYRSTYSELTVGDVPINDKNFYLASDDYISRMGTAFGVNVLAATACHAPNPTNLTCRYAVVMGRIVDDGSYDNGTPTPVADIGRDEITIKGEGDPNWYKQGPYLLRPDGQPAGGITTTQRERDPVTQKYRGGLYVVFVEVPISGNPPREFEISASSYAGGTVRRNFGPVIFKAFNGGLSWVTIAESGQTPGQPPNQPPPPPPPPQNVNFDTQVYPLFLPVSQGGFGCQGCHTNQGGAQPAAGMNLYGSADACSALNPQQYPLRVNLQSPRDSYLLKKPLYEADGNQDHPIFAFVSDADPAYQTLYAWIREGAQCLGGGVVDPPVSFYNEVRPLLYQPEGQGGIGCYNCHVSGVNANNAPGGAYFGGNGNDLYQVLTQQTPTDNGQTGEPYRINKTAGQAALSLLLLNPLVGSPEPHPAKLLNGTADPRYQTIYRWINQGYVNDTP
jgi:hypothetical protein